MNEASRAFEEAINSSHRGTRWALWVVIGSAGYLFVRIII